MSDLGVVSVPTTSELAIGLGGLGGLLIQHTGGRTGGLVGTGSDVIGVGPGSSCGEVEQAAVTERG